MHRLRPIALLLAWTAILRFTFVPALANPLGGQVVGGSAAISGTGTSTVTVTQSSQNAAINWQSFNIGAGEKTQFIQPSSTSTVLNRVIGDPNASQIFGALTANGRVYLINPNGVLIGNGATINTAGFLATTHDIATGDFMAGNYKFNIPGNPSASVVNLGTITASNAGFAALVAPGVRNSGTITATYGKIGLASANGFTLDPYGDQLITLSVSDSIAAQVKDVATGQTLQSLVKNEGTLSANGGRVELTAVAARQVVDSVINNKGVIEARSIGLNKGRIVLGAATVKSKPAGAPKQTVKVSGTLNVASADGNGGTIQVTGEDVQIAGATLSASGLTGGGKVLIGGDVGGGNPLPMVTSLVQLEGYEIPNATTVSVDGASAIDASATGTGDGGKVVVWADGATAFAGSIAARGGAAGGNGGFVEVSGKETLTFDGNVNVGAAGGLNGMLLLDPLNGRIDTVAGAGVITVGSIVNALQSGDVVVTTNNAVGNEAGDLTVAAAINWSTNNNLWLTAYRNVIVNAAITNTYSGPIVSDKHEINLVADSTGTGVGTVMFGANGSINTGANGKVHIAFNPSVNPAGSGINGTSYVNPTEDFGPNVTGGILKQYMKVNTATDLQNVQNNLTDNYLLGRNINMNGVTGFVPIGESTAADFTGEFVGLNNTISNLTINSSATNVGLFRSIGANAEVEGVLLENFVVTSTATSGSVNIGALAGQNLGRIGDVNVINANVTTSRDGNIGALVGLNTGASATVKESNSSGQVNISATASTINAGGLVGSNASNAQIQSAFSLVSVTSNATGTGVQLGGVAGFNNATMSRLYARGSVTGTTNNAAGGIVGRVDGAGTVSEAYAANVVTAGGVIGGVTGQNSAGSTVYTNVYWDTNVGLAAAVGLGDATGTTGKTTVQLQGGLGNLPGFSSTDWAYTTGFNGNYPHLKFEKETDNRTSLTPQGPSSTVPDNIFHPPQFGNNPPPGDPPPLVLIALNQPGSGPGAGGSGGPGAGPGGPGGPGTNPPIGPGGSIPSAAPGMTTFSPPQLPPRTVAGPDGEALSSIPPLTENRFVQNQVLMQLNFNLSDADIARIVGPLGIRVVTTDALTIHGRNMFQLVLPPGMSVRQAIRLLEANRLVSVAAPIYNFFLTQAASTPSKGDPAQYMLTKLGLDKVHQVATGKGVTIAVIDSEVDKRHSELQGAISSELNPIGAKPVPHSHGTAMAGAIASRDRLLGVAPEAKILAVKAFGEASDAAGGTTVSIVKGIEWAVSQGAKVINMSFAGPRDPSLERALKAAHDKGVILIAAAGNAGPKSPPLYPAADPHVIAVTATDSRDRIFRGANQGPQVSVAAPGVEILAPAPDSAYQMSTGTSIATAHISGVVALMLERDPTLRPADVRRILEATASDLGTKGKDIESGWGLVNPQKALEAVAGRRVSDATGARR